ncbi:hypothetical protein COY25_02870 [Candidatus Uhrbacteria bacterium CG_4_10_14_0_2_um_filter_41_7]|uniref:Lipoprotein n=1 Tax=Candidatus Uhrbacteria bacterium CG_4_9_14_3_um_filter_41_35 TaxID=1975034 RepID=A0A2M7XFB6_9BACT|nr:MAG: hypothetical protein COV92_01160 [Candidatus Uhrbacteria bacterium CG11_big_fil_rev_8_21_14_0_20_41_9]PIZ53886.1 MAG: hypothetical protein COY25_02870 [Candidatus Uhrbacteria bacterium CG_4_10_14_0_2_um_filter_41_7]PJA46563.1 MAG: hypothetical protein CO173_02235 [Candidatus Uhrbacteria bacterium CG_4_9_14_3_um_filter_41_35]
MTRFLFSVVFFVAALTGCDVGYNPGYGGPGTSPTGGFGGCNTSAPWGTEYCQGDFDLPGSNHLEVVPSDTTSTWLELGFSYRGRQNTDGSWVDHGQTVVVYPGWDGTYAVTMPNAPPDGDVEVSGQLIFEGITSKEVFCGNTEWGEAGVRFGDYEVTTRTDTSSCVLSWSNDRLN